MDTNNNPLSFSVDAIVAIYETKGKLLFNPDGTRSGNALAVVFWAGVDGLTSGRFVPPRKHVSYNWGAAGRLVRKNIAKGVYTLKEVG